MQNETNIPENLINALLSMSKNSNNSAQNTEKLLNENLSASQLQTLQAVLKDPQKIKEMLSTEEGQKWATDFDKKTTDYTSDVKATWSYEKDYVKNAVNNTPRFCNFTDSYKPE